MKRKALALLLALILAFSLVIPAAAVKTDDPLSIADAKVTKFTVKLDGKDLAITQLEDEYVASPTSLYGNQGFAKDGVNYVDQGISIYVPETATADSPVYFMVDNGGWQGDNYSGRKQIYPEGTVVEDRNGKVVKGSYVSDSDTDNIGAALARGMVVVSFGCRSRNNDPDAAGNYLGHSPATMTDTKAALRYLRYNAAELGVGDMDRIVITGTSGGGALSAIIAASGNSADFYPSLYAIGAAGIEKQGDTYVSTIGDDVFGTIAYCPINDLREADQAYEWTYGTARKALVADGFEWWLTKGMGPTAEKVKVVNDEVMKASPVLAAAYPTYVESLNIPYGDGTLNGNNMEKAMLALLNAELADTLAEGNTYEAMKAEVEQYGNKDSSWLVQKEDGTLEIGDLQAYLLWVATKQDLKAAPAFSNLGMNIAGQNEDSLFGTEEFQYSAYEFYSWDNDATANNGCGKDDTGLTWDAFMKTDAGKALALQCKMASPIDYLTVDADNAESAPYWYVRHGMADRDTSFALQSTLYYAMAGCSDIEDLNFEFAWLQGHAGDYDVQEAFAWLDGILAIVDPTVVASPQKLLVNRTAVSTEAYNINGYNYFKLRDIAEMLKGTEAKFAVDFDNAKHEVYITTGGDYASTGTELQPGTDKSATCVKSAWTVFVDGEKVNVLSYNIGGYNFFKLRDLGAALGFEVGYDKATNTATITSPYTLDIADAEKTALTVTVDGKKITVDWYVDGYLAAPNNPDNQKINVFVPETATKSSPVIFLVENGGWMSNSYAGAAQVKDGQAYVSTAADGKDAVIGRALSEGYVIVSYGARGRNDNGGLIGEEYACHSPATMTDTKAAIRYLRYNAAALTCDLDKIVVTGTSGGGALSTVIAASGNSEDYFESLYEIGAAGVTKAADGTYASTIDDDVFSVIAYCPITDLGHADQAYEWMYGDTRKAYAADGLSLEEINPNPGGMGAPTNTDQVFGEAVLAASKELAADYVTYFDALGLTDENGKALKASDGSFKAAIEGLLEASIEKELTTEYPSSDAAPADGAYTWLTIADGKADIDMPGYLYWIGTKMSGLKTAPAFSNRGTANAHPILNEDNIFGSKAVAYSNFEFWSWNNNNIPGDGIGKDDTGLTFDEYLKTADGAYLLKQIRMTNAIEYLNDDAAAIDIAPYWYVRHGMGDRDTAFPVAATMYYSLLANDAVEEVSFNYAWLKGHAGNYDVQEAYDWLDSVVK